LALWNLKTFKLEKIINDIHESEVVGAKIYQISEDRSSMGLISIEKNGPVYNSDFKL